MDSWDKRRLEDGLKRAREFVGRSVKVTAGGMWARGELLDVSTKFEARIKTPKNGIQVLAPLEKIEAQE